MKLGLNCCSSILFLLVMSTQEGFASSRKKGRSLEGAKVGDPTPNRCADMDLALFRKGQICGAPLSQPCFDHDRCLPPPNGPGPTVYVYDNECSLADSNRMETGAKTPTETGVSSAWRAAAKEAGILAETYASACVFIYLNTVHQNPCATSSPLWNDGVNHLMVDYTDGSRAERPKIANSYAMEAASNVHTCYYRSGYDLSVPLFPHKVYPELADISPRDRKYFATVKGSVYLSNHGSEERMSVVPLHDEAHGVISSMHCFEAHGEHLLANNAEYCQELKDRYDDFSYGELMNTTFGLIPAGRSPGAFRLGEVMSAGAIPVFIGRDLVPPFREKYDWGAFSLMFSPDEVGPGMLKTLRAVPAEAVKEMQRQSLAAYWKMFGGTTNSFETIARNVLDELVRRVSYCP